MTVNSNCLLNETETDAQQDELQYKLNDPDKLFLMVISTILNCFNFLHWCKMSVQILRRMRYAVYKFLDIYKVNPTQANSENDNQEHYANMTPSENENTCVNSKSHQVCKLLLVFSVRKARISPIAFFNRQSNFYVSCV